MENETSITPPRSLALPFHAYALGAVFVVLSLLVYVHYKTTIQGEDYTGLLAPLDRLFDLGLALGLALVAYAVGRAFGRKLSLDYKSVAEEISFSILLGTGTMGLAILGLGLMGLLSPAPTIALLTLFVAASRREFIEAFGRTRTALGSVRGALSGERITGIIFTALCLSLLYYMSTAAIYGHSLLYTFLTAVATLALAHLLGRRLSLPSPRVHENLSQAATRGVAIGFVCALNLNMIGFLSPLSIALLELLLCSLFHREAVQLFDSIKEDFRRSVTLPKARQLSLMLLALLCAILLLNAWTPPDSYDEGIYHLAAIKLFVEQGRIYPLYDNALGNMPFLTHMVYAICLMARSDIAARLFSLILAINTALAVYAFCARFLTRRIGWLALLGFYGASMVTEVAVTARIDVTLTGMLFATTYSMMAYLESRRQGWLYASAVLAGFSLGIKMTAAVWLLPIAVMFLYESFIRNRVPLLSVLKRGLMFALIMAAMASPWYVKNYVWFGNPAYPFLTGELAEYEKGSPRYFTLEDDRKLEGYFNAAREEIPDRVDNFEKRLEKSAAARIERHPWRVWEYFLRPDIYEVGEYNITPNYLFLALPLLLFVAPRRWLLWLLVVAIFFFLFVTRTVWIARYWLPMFPALTIAAVYALDRIAKSLKRRCGTSLALPAAAVFLIFASVIYANITKLQTGSKLSFIAGHTSRREFLNQRFYYPSIDFINRQLPVDARVMMIGVQMNYDLKRAFIADTSWDGTDWQRMMLRNNSFSEVREDLKRRGITHIIYNPNLYFLAAEWGPQAGPTAGTPSRRTGAYSFAGLTGLEQKTGAEGSVEPDYKVQLRVLATFENFRLKFLERLYTDRYGYEVYRIL